MKRFVKNYLEGIRWRKNQQDYDTEQPPVFSLSPEFIPLTYDQRELLFYLIKASKKNESHMGEFQWCIDTIPTVTGPPLNCIMGLRPVEFNTRKFDINNPMFKNYDWKRIVRRGQMKSLEDAGYISISPIYDYIGDDQNPKMETWAHFCLNQKAYDYFRFMNYSSLRRFFHILWENSQKHFVTIIISLISGVAGAIIIKLLIG